MSNILNLRELQHRQRASSSTTARACDREPDAALSNEDWRTTAIEQIKNSILLLDLAAQQARLMTRQISDQQVRRSLIGQIEIIEKLMQVARDMSATL